MSGSHRRRLQTKALQSNGTTPVQSPANEHTVSGSGNVSMSGSASQQVGAAANEVPMVLNTITPSAPASNPGPSTGQNTQRNDQEPADRTVPAPKATTSPPVRNNPATDPPSNTERNKVTLAQLEDRQDTLQLERLQFEILEIKQEATER